MSERRLRVLILGGYGQFGGNLVRLLGDEPGFSLLVAGRSREKAASFCRGLPVHAELVPTAMDRDGDVAAGIAAVAPDVVVDASGPFQGYGGDPGADPYRVARAAMACGSHYLDLADATGFVAGIATLDGEAKVRNVAVLSGVSSYPALTAAAVRRLADGLDAVDAIVAGIAPSPRAEIGPNVLRAIASYAGKPVRYLRDGQSTVGHGLIDVRRFTIAPPGRLPLDSRRFTLVAAPDLEVLPRAWPGVRDIWTGAAAAPQSLHRALSVLAWLVRAGLLGSLATWAPVLHRVRHLARWGEHRGGMFVRIEGRKVDGAPATRTWHLLAEGDDGPLVPAMACAAIIQRIFAGSPPPAGARPGTSDIDLADYERQFTGRALHAGMRENADDSGRPLYARVLGSAWSGLPAPIREMHEMGGGLTAHGMAVVERGAHPVARAIAAVFGFPAAGRDIPVSVRFTPTATPDARPGELWTRTFAGRNFASHQSAGVGRSEHLIDERFGPFVFGLALVVDGELLRLVPRRWTAFGVPMPRFLMPHGDSHERVEAGRFQFHVEICLPLVGVIVRYRGHLTPRSHA